MTKTAAPPIRVLALAKYGQRAASTRQRLLQFAPYLAAHSVELELRPLLDDSYLAALMEGRPRSRIAIARAYAQRVRDVAQASRFDLVWLQYELFPYLPFIDGIAAAWGRIPVVYDIDDAIFHMYDAHSSRAVRALLAGKLEPVVRRAAVCLCGNAYLRDYVIKAGGRGIVVPTVVDTDQFRPAERRADRPLTVGWIGSPSTWAYVEPLLPTLLPALRQLDARFRVIGAGPRARGIDGVEALDWDEAREVADLQAMDIGLMPVPNEPWARGKCGYKLIQYMACGLPAIGSPVGVNSVIVDHEVTGFLASNDREWLTAVDRLARDPDLRRRMGAAGRRKVVDGYSLASQQPIVLDALRFAATGSVRPELAGR